MPENHLYEERETRTRRIRRNIIGMIKSTHTHIFDEQTNSQ